MKLDAASTSPRISALERNCMKLCNGREKNRADAEEQDNGQYCNQAVRGHLQQDRGDGQANGPQRHDPQFHLWAGNVRCQEGSAADAEGRGKKEITALGFVKAQVLHTVHDEIQLSKSTHQPEPGQTYNR